MTDPDPMAWAHKSEDKAIIYVGTDEKQQDAELVLEYSVRKHASIPVEFVWMRHGDEGTFWDGWNFNWQYGQKRGGAHWHTNFTVFRYAIPGFQRYQGRAIYMDSDIVVLKDIADLWRTPMKAPWKCVSGKRTCVSLIDCAPFQHATWWPDVKAMKKEPREGAHYRQLLITNRFLDPTLPDEWNCPDGFGFSDRTAVLHFTTMETQPWKPWDGVVKYRNHASPRMAMLWWKYFEEAKAAKAAVERA